MITETKTKKKQAKIELQNPNTGFKIKLTNMKTQYFPDELKETDILKVKIGDIVSIGWNVNTLYKVVDIYRDMISTIEYENWKKRLITYFGVIIDQKIYDFLEKYKNSGNFGVCRIKIKTVLRGDKLPIKGGVKILKELDVVSPICYKDLKVTDLKNIVRLKINSESAFEYQIKAIVTKKDKIVKQRKAVELLIDTLNPNLNPPVEVAETVFDVESSF